MVIVQGRSTGFVITQHRAKLGNYGSRSLDWQHQRQHHYQNETPPAHLCSPDSKNVLGCRLALPKYHRLALCGRFVSQAPR
jgi:hypothetical protein